MSHLIPVTGLSVCSVDPIPPFDASQFGDYLHDESKLTASGAVALARPSTVEELRATYLSWAKEKRPIIFSASRTGLTGAAVPTPRASILSTERCSGILSLDQKEQRVRVLPGTQLKVLQEYLAEHSPGLYFPVDPTETSASIGGMVATNAGGSRSYYYGSMRPWVRGLTVELPTGYQLNLQRGKIRAENGTLEFAAPLGTLRAKTIAKPKTKNTLGYFFHEEVDPIDLFIGAEGTLGLVSEIELALAPTPINRLVQLQFFENDDAAFTFVDELRARHDLPVLAIEFVDRRSIEMALTSSAAKTNAAIRLSGDFQCAVYTEAVWTSDDELIELSETLTQIVTQVGGSERGSIAGTEDRELRTIKEFRHAVPETINRTIAQRKQEHPALHKIATDMAVTNQDLRWVYDMYRNSLREAGLDFAIFGHIGDNHFHVNMLPKDPEELLRAKDLYRSWAPQVVARGGAVAAEHGIGRLKREFLAIQYDSETLATMKGIKQFFDPDGLLSPGVLVS